MKNRTACSIGLGYDGMPLANAFVIENKSVKWEEGRRWDGEDKMREAKGTKQKANE